MTKIEIFDIVLDNPARVYFAGDMVRGEVVLGLTEAVKINSITVTFSGGAEVYWTTLSSTDSKGKASHNQTSIAKHYRNWENYCSNSSTLFEKDGDLESTMPAGRHTFPFQQSIPKSAPSSVEGGYGSIRYCLKASISRPWKMSPDETRKAFTVVGMVDLNTLPNVLCPRTGMIQKSDCCILCTRGSVTVEFQVQRRGYVPGEYVTLQGQVINGSSKKIKSTKLQLRMTLTFQGYTGRKTRLHKIVSSIRRGELLPGGREDWSNRKLHIPPVPPSPLINCSCMAISYHVVLKAERSGLSREIEVPLKINIGTIPLKNVPSTYSLAKDTSTTGDNPESLEIIPLPPAYQEICYEPPPPSYEECLFGKIDLSKEYGRKEPKLDPSYTPMFPYYSISLNNLTK